MLEKRWVQVENLLTRKLKHLPKSPELVEGRLVTNAYPHTYWAESYEIAPSNSRKAASPSVLLKHETLIPVGVGVTIF